MKKQAASEFDAYDQTYSESVNRAIAFSGMKVDFFARVKTDYFVDLIESRRPPASRAEVLDIGCGVANAHPFLARRVGRIAGVDVSGACIAKAAEQNPNNDYKSFDGINLPYPNDSFDVASAACVFHHVPVAHRVDLVRDIRRVLRPGGLFAMFEHNPLNPLTRHVVNNCEFDKDATLLGHRAAERLFHEAGFRAVVTQFILTVPPAGRILRAVDRTFARLPIGAQYLTAGRV